MKRKKPEPWRGKTMATLRMEHRMNVAKRATNAQDATLRNIRALKARVKRLEEAVDVLTSRMDVVLPDLTPMSSDPDA